MSRQLPCVHLTPRLCNADIKAYTLPSLPKVHCKATLVTTKLCEQIFKSRRRAGLSFDLTSPREDLSPTHLYQYNSLHDPHLRSYLNQPTVLSKLVENGFVTDKYNVVYSLKDYNMYRRFLEKEYLKGYAELLDERVNSMKSPRPVSKGTRVRPMSELDREEKRKEFFWQQEKRQKWIQHKHKKMLEEENRNRDRDAKRKQVKKEKDEVKRNQENEKKCLKKLEKHYKETIRKDAQKAKTLIEEDIRLSRLDKQKKEQRISIAKELEKKWKTYDDNVEAASSEMSARRTERDKEKLQKMQERSNTARILHERLEERRRMVMDVSRQQVLALKKEADEFEQELKLAREYQMVLVKAKLKKEHLYWTQYLDSRVAIASDRHRSSNMRSVRSSSSAHLAVKKPGTLPTRRLLTHHHRVYTPLVLYTNRQSTPKLLDEKNKNGGDISSMKSSTVVLKTSLPPSRESKMKPELAIVPEVVVNEGNEASLSTIRESPQSLEGISRSTTKTDTIGDEESTELALDLTKLCDDSDDTVDDIGDTCNVSNEGDIPDTTNTTDIGDTEKPDTADTKSNDDSISADKSSRKVQFSIPDMTTTS